MRIYSRRALPTDDAAITGQIAATQREIDRLVVDHRELSEERQSVLLRAQHEFNAGEVADFDRAIAANEEKQQTHRDRLAALEATRSTPEQREAATKQVAAMIAQMTEASAVIATQAQDLLSALDAAMAVARELVTVRTAAYRLRREADDIVARHGLTVRVPAHPEVHDLDQHVMSLVAKYCMDAVSDEPDELVTRELVGARAKRAAALAPAPVPAPVQATTPKRPRQSALLAEM